MKKINVEVLQKGDVVLSTSTATESRAIRLVTLSDISHAMLCVSRSSVMDSTGEGVQARNPDKIHYQDSCAVYILRLKDPISNNKLDAVINYVRENVGKPYTVEETFLTVAKIGKGSSKQFCSRLVARAFASVGIKLVMNPNFCTPAGLKRSKLLKLVDNPTVSVSKEDVDNLKQYGDKTEGMRYVTTSLINKAKEIFSEIEDLNDITRIAIERPEYDEDLSKALKDSGYLDYWREEINEYSWRYNPQEMVSYYLTLHDPSSLLDYCTQTLDDEKNGVFNHWKITEYSLREYFRDYPRKTLEVMLELYLNLNKHHHLRIATAKYLMEVFVRDSS